MDESSYTRTREAEMRRTLTRLIAREAEMRRTLKRFIGLFGWMMLVQAFGTASGCDNVAGGDKAPFEPQRFGSVAEFLSIQQDPSDLCADGVAEVRFSGIERAFGFPISLAAGDELSADTIGTVGLDTILALYGPADSDGFFGEVPVAADDDGGGGSTSHMTWTAKSTGGFQLVVATYDGKGEGAALLHVAVNGTPGCSGGPPGCEVAPTANCAINGSSADCSVAFEISHPAVPGDSPRAKCDSLCSSGDSTHLNGIFGDRTPCQVVIQGLDCNACCGLSDAALAEVPCIVP